MNKSTTIRRITSTSTSNNNKIQSFSTSIQIKAPRYSNSNSNSSRPTRTNYNNNKKFNEYPIDSDPRYEDDPRLPKTSRLPPINSDSSSSNNNLPTIDSISPTLLSALRFKIMSMTARPPSRSELSMALPGFLKKERAKEESNLKLAFHKVRTKIKLEKQMDVARKWAEDMEVKVGLLKQEERDKSVRDRLERDREDWIRNGRSETEFEDVNAWRIKNTKDQEDKYLRSRKYSNYSQEAVEISSSSSSPSILPSSSNSLPSIKSSTIAVGSELRTLGTSPPPSRPTSKLHDDNGEPLPDWRIQKLALKDKFPLGWSPPKVISTEAKSLLKLLQRSNPELYTTSLLAERFKISPEAVRRILKSQFELSQETIDKREKKRLEERKLNGGGESWGGNVGRQRDEMRVLREGVEMERERSVAESAQSRYSKFPDYNDDIGHLNSPSNPRASSSSSFPPRSNYSSPPRSSSNSYDRSGSFKRNDRSSSGSDRGSRGSTSSRDRDSGNGGPKQVSWTD